MAVSAGVSVAGASQGVGRIKGWPKEACQQLFTLQFELVYKFPFSVTV